MLDIIGSIFISTAFALVVGTIAVYLPRDLATRWLVSAALWGAILVGLAAIGAFAPGATRPDSRSWPRIHRRNSCTIRRVWTVRTLP